MDGDGFQRNLAWSAVDWTENHIFADAPQLELDVVTVETPFRNGQTESMQHMDGDGLHSNLAWSTVGALKLVPKHLAQD